jgi:transposase
VDVSGEHLDARVGEAGPYQRFARTPDGIAHLASFCRQHQVTLVAMEATGGCEKLPFALLWQENLPCAILNPRQVRRYAEAMGTIEKTDRIDAGIIAAFANTKKVKPQTPAQANQKALTALTTRVRQLTQLKTVQGNQRRFCDDAVVLADIDSLAAEFEQRIDRLLADMLELIEQDPLWSTLSDCFRSIKGIADHTVAGVLAFLPEIGALSNKSIAKLAGLAPIAHDSGRRQGKRPVRGGRAPVRSLLVVVAGGVAKHNADIGAFHQRLLDAGKPPLSARVAVAHKILVRLNAKARDARKNLAIAT